MSNDRPDGVGRNSERGSARFDMSIRLARGFAFGGVPQGRSRPGGRDGGGPVEIGGGGPAAAGQAGPGGPVPAAGAGVGPGLAGGPAQRVNVDFYVQASNVLNRTNFLNYSGNLQSPFFGRPTSAAAARRIEMGMQFRF